MRCSRKRISGLPGVAIPPGSDARKSLTAPVDVLVANPKITGAARAIEVLKSTQPDLRVLLIRDPADDSPIQPVGDATLERPSAGESISKEQWMMKIRKLLMRFSAAKDSPQTRGQASPRLGARDRRLAPNRGFCSIPKKTSAANFRRSTIRRHDSVHLAQGWQ